MKRLHLVAVMILFLSSIAMADIIMLHDGSVYLGKISSTDSNGIVIESFGQTLTISQSDILKSAKNFDSFKDLTTDIILRDGSIIKGKIQNYDEEIGVFVNVDFGTITLPVQSIKEISDHTQKIKSKGYNYLAGVTFGYYQPIGGTGKFSASYLTSAFLERDSAIVNGLFAGLGLNYLDMNHENKDLNYSMFMLEPYLSYKIMGFRNSSNTIVKRLIPFVFIGCGFNYIQLTDNRPSALKKNSSELDPVYTAGVGSDVEITEQLMLRISGGWNIVPQSSGFFQTASLSLGVVYGF